MKRYLIFFVTLAVLISSPGVLAAEEGEGVALSLEQAISIMQDNSIALRIAQLNKEIAELDYQRAVASNLMTDSQYSKLEAEYNRELANNTYVSALNTNYLEVLRSYSHVLAAQRTLEERKIETQLAEDSYRVLQEKIRIGDAGSLDELQERNLLENAKRDEQAARQDLEESQRVLKQLIGLTAKIEALTTEFTKIVSDITLEQSIELALENSFDLWAGQYDLKLQEMELQKQRVDGTPPIDVKKTELRTEIARLNVEKIRSDLIEEVTRSYQALGQSLALYEAAEREYQIATDSYQISQRQAEAGLITDKQLIEAELTMIKADNSRHAALINYHIALVEFNQLLGINGEI